METGFSQEALKLLAQIPDHPAPVQALPGKTSPAGRRHLLRRLIHAGLVEATVKRPLAVRIARSDAAVLLRDFVRRNPQNAALLAGATLPVLSALAAAPGPTGSSVNELSHEVSVHENTVRASLQRLRHRGLVTKPRGGYYALAEHARTERIVAEAYARHCLHEVTPRGALVTAEISPLVRILESDRDLALPLTAISRFQEAGAAVIAKRFQARLHAFRKDRPVSLETALDDARRLKTPPRTLRVMERFVHG